jgi:hypothetical protein
MTWAMSSNGIAKTSWSTKARRSAGVRLSRTTSSARPIESASTACCSGPAVIGLADQRLRQPAADGVLAPGLAGPEHIQADPRDHRGQPGAQVIDRAGVAAAEPQPGLLHRILGLAERAEHAVGDRLQMRAALLELLGQPALVRHLPSSRPRVTCPQDVPRPPFVTLPRPVAFPGGTRVRDKGLAGPKVDSGCRRCGRDGSGQAVRARWLGPGGAGPGELGPGSSGPGGMDPTARARRRGLAGRDGWEISL